MRRWRGALLCSAALLAAQLFRLPTLIDVASGSTAEAARLQYPALHIILAPVSLLADWLNGGSTGDLIGFSVWALVAFVVARAFANAPRRAGREALLLLTFVGCFGGFVWWGARWNRPIPRLVPADSSVVIFDIHSHTAASHDGRPGFDAAANAAWHRRAGFNAAFVTDHNVFGQAYGWRRSHPGEAPRLLDGEELSLNGLHLIVLGNQRAIANEPWNRSFDSSLALLRAIHVDDDDSATPFLIASLPEYSEHHWGADLGALVSSGVQGLEIWTTSPRAMTFPPDRRHEVVARARSLGLALFGATDMHGLGNAATVWNVARLPGWRGMSDAALTAALLEMFRTVPSAVHVVAINRRVAPTNGAQLVGTPLSIVMLLRTMPIPHAMVLVAWIWGAALLAGPRRRPRQ